MPAKITIEFNDQYQEKLDKLSTKYKSPSEALRAAIDLLDALNSEAAKGFTEVSLRNPERASSKKLYLKP